MFGGNFAPLGWSFCDGSMLSISEYEPLFTLIGTTYGGDGSTTFQLPDLRGRFPIHYNSSNFVLGQQAGVETVTLTTAQLPAHTHNVMCNSTGGSESPAGNYLGGSNNGKPYAVAGGGTVNFNSATIQGAGGNQPHENMHPFQAVNYIVALEGIFPSFN